MTYQNPLFIRDKRDHIPRKDTIQGGSKKENEQLHRKATSKIISTISEQRKEIIQYTVQIKNNLSRRK